VSVLPWTDDFCVGVPELDAQHRRLVELLDSLEEAFRSDENWEQQEAAFIELARYVEHHFNAEEVFMREVGYPHLEEHIHMHLHFQGRFNNIQTRFWRCEEDLGPEVLKFLSHWIQKHTLQEDQKYAAWLKEQRLADPC
jgi:hemerythrin-like metal-binding protein